MPKPQEQDISELLTDEQKKRQELLGTIARALGHMERVEALGRSMVESARLYRDVATPVLDLIAKAPANVLSSTQLMDLDDSATAVSATADRIESVLSDVTLLSAAASGFLSTSNTVVRISLPTVAEIETATHELMQVVARRPMAEQVLSTMRSLDLDRRQGDNRAPVEFLQEAKAALERPVREESTPTAILMPLRSCIDEVLNQLTRRMPHASGKVPKREKISSIGVRSGLKGLSDGHFVRLAADYSSLKQQLSDSKLVGMSRERVSQLFHEGVAFLNALLNSLDNSRVRPLKGTERER